MSESFKIENLINNISDIERNNESIEYYKNQIQLLSKNLDQTNYKYSILEDKLHKSENLNFSLEIKLKQYENKPIQSNKEKNPNSEYIIKFKEMQDEIANLKSNLESTTLELDELRSQMWHSDSTYDVDNHMNMNDYLTVNYQNYQTSMRNDDISLASTQVEKGVQAWYINENHVHIQTDYFDPDEVIRLRDEVMKLKSLNLSKDKEILKRDEEILRLKSYIKQMENDRDKALNEEMQRLKDEISKLNATLDLTQQDRDRYKKMYEELKANLDKNNNEIIRLRITNEKLEKSLEEKDNYYTKIIDELKDKIAYYQSLMGEKGDKLMELEGKILEYTVVIEKCMEAIRMSDAQNDELRLILDSVLYKGNDVKEALAIPEKQSKVLQLKLNEGIYKKIGKKTPVQNNNLKRESMFNKSLNKSKADVNV